MRPVGYHSHNLVRRLSAALVLAGAASAASASVIHKYTFNANNANDSVGTAHGTLVDNTGIASYTGGALNLTNNNNLGSGQNFALPTTAGAFVDLPNGLFTGAALSTAGGGVFGQVSIETWVTVQQNRTWSRIWDMGTSGPGEGLSGDSPTAQYVFLAGQIGAATNGAAASTHNTGDSFAAAPTPLSVNVRHHVVATFDQFDATGGPFGTTKLYIDNQAPVVAAIADGLFLDAIIDNNNWIGRAQWNDPLFDGFIDELRVYNHTLTATEVGANFTQGPDPAPVPTLVVNRDTGEIRVANQTPGNIQLKGYSIGSVAGSLNPAAWTSIDAGNAFDGDGTWTPTGTPSNALIAESVTGGVTDGGQLTTGATPGASRTVGTPWLKTPFADLTFNFTLGDNSTGSGLVQYTGAAPVRSDFNGDGAVTAADWLTFKNNGYTSFAGQPAAQAYLKGDLDGDLDSDFLDYRLFKNDFIAANGAPAFAALTGAVPEPSTVTLGALAVGLLWGTTRRRVNR